jgi:hypothetical protein
MAGQRDELVHLVQLAALDVGERVLLAVDHALLEGDVEIAESDLLGGGAERLEAIDRHRIGGVRIFRPARSAGLPIGRLALVVWRMPLSHQSTFQNGCWKSWAARPMPGQRPPYFFRPACDCGWMASPCLMRNASPERHA